MPFYSEIPTELFELIRDAKIDYDALKISDPLKDLLKQCLEKDPDFRAGVGDCLKHPFLKRAREQRIMLLGAEFESSSRKMVVLNEDDIKSVCFQLF